LPAAAAASPPLPVFELRAHAYNSRISVHNPRISVTSQAVHVPHVTDVGTAVSFAETGALNGGITSCSAVMVNISEQRRTDDVIAASYHRDAVDSRHSECAMTVSCCTTA
jgi:hypothetical protein